MKVRFTLNGKPVELDMAPGMTLLEYLRSNGIYSVKHGCDHGECGACAVLVDGKALNSCLVLPHTLEGRTVETLEGIATGNEMHHAGRVFIEDGAIQCGYCTPGMIISAEALRREGGDPGEADIRDALNGHLCRCTGYVKPVNAVKRFLAETKAERSGS